MKKCYGRGSAPFENSSTGQILRPFWPGREGDSKLLFWEQRIRDRFDRWIGINFIFDEISKRRDALIVSMLICQCCDVILWKTSNEKKKNYIPPPPPVPYLSLHSWNSPRHGPPPPLVQIFSRKYRARRILSPRKNEYFYYCNTPHSPEKKKRKKNS